MKHFSLSTSIGYVKNITKVRDVTPFTQNQLQFSITHTFFMSNAFFQLSLTVA